MSQAASLHVSVEADDLDARTLICRVCGNPFPGRIGWQPMCRACFEITRGHRCRRSCPPCQCPPCSCPECRSRARLAGGVLASEPGR